MTWITVYEGNKIMVENSWMTERLWVNGTLQDEQLGMAFRSRLWGSIRVPGAETKIIKVNLGTTTWRVECRIFVNDELVFSGK